jgi:hypothetical protein
MIRALCWALTIPLAFALACIGLAVLLRDLWKERAARPSHPE